MGAWALTWPEKELFFNIYVCDNVTGKEKMLHLSLLVYVYMYVCVYFYVHTLISIYEYIYMYT
jgi:hypothetical protein